MSRWEHWSVGEEPRSSFSSFMAEQGNPTGGGTQTPADKARAMGLQSDGKGGYRDPKTGQLVARTVNGELAFYDPGPGGGIVADGNGGAYVTQAQPSWRDSRHGMAMTPPARPESKQEIAAVPYPTPATPPMGFNTFMKQKQEKAYAQDNPIPETPNPEAEMQADAEDAMMGEAVNPGPPPRGYRKGHPQFKKYDADLSAFQAANPRPQPTGAALDGMIKRNSPTPAEKPAVKPVTTRAQTTQAGQRFKDFQQKADEPQGTPAISKPLETDKSDLLPDNEEDISLQSLEDQAKRAYGNWTTARIGVDQRIEQNFAPLKKLLDAGQGGNAFRKLAMRMLQYRGKNNNATNFPNYEEVQGIMENAQNLREAYGSDDSPNIEGVRKYTESVKSSNYSDELKRAAFNALPPGLRKTFKGGDYETEYDGFSDYCDQDGNCAYSGSPLDLESMNAEHVIDRSRLNSKDTPDEVKEFIKSRGNHAWVGKAPNQTKGKKGMNAFLDDGISPISTMPREFFDFTDGTLLPGREKLKNDELGLIGQGLVNRDGDRPMLNEGVTEEGLSAIEELVGSTYNDAKKDMTSTITDKFDTEGLLKLRGQAAKDMTPEQVKKRDQLRKLKSDVAKLGGSPGRRLFKALGLTNGYQQTNRARTSDIGHDDIYRALSRGLLGKSPEDQQKMMDSYNDAVQQAGALTRANAEGASGTQYADADLRNMSGKKFVELAQQAGFLSPEILGRFPNAKRFVDQVIGQVNEEFGLFEEDMTLDTLTQSISSFLDNYPID